MMPDRLADSMAAAGKSEEVADGGERSGVEEQESGARRRGRGGSRASGSNRHGKALKCGGTGGNSVCTGGRGGGADEGYGVVNSVKTGCERRW